MYYEFNFGDINFGTVTVVKEKFLPTILVELGVFKSKTQLKNNRKDLWRELESGEVIKIGRKRIRIYSVAAIISIDENI